MGRTGNPPASTTAWDGNRLVITTLYPFQDPETGELRRQKVVQTLWLALPAGTPWEPGGRDGGRGYGESDGLYAGI